MSDYILFVASLRVSGQMALAEAYPYVDHAYADVSEQTDTLAQALNVTIVWAQVSAATRTAIEVDPRFFVAAWRQVDDPLINNYSEIVTPTILVQFGTWQALNDVTIPPELSATMSAGAGVITREQMYNGILAVMRSLGL